MPLQATSSAPVQTVAACAWPGAGGTVRQVPVGAGAADVVEDGSGRDVGLGGAGTEDAGDVEAGSSTVDVV